MKQVVILTGSEPRHIYFRKFIAASQSIKVLRSYCESDDLNLLKRILYKKDCSRLEKSHAEERVVFEKLFFDEYNFLVPDESAPKYIVRGEINSESVVSEIIQLAPDLIISFGCSLIKSRLISEFDRRFINIHLGLSPYYRGSATLLWPLVHNRPQYVGATFMSINEGIDAGQIYHQILGRILATDNPHTLGFRLIKDMVETMCSLILCFDQLDPPDQINVAGNLYFREDFGYEQYLLVYENLSMGLLRNFLENRNDFISPVIIENKGIKND